MILDETALKVEVCPKCGSTDYWRYGFHKSKRYGKVRHVQCKICKRWYYLTPSYVKGKRYHQKIFNLVIHLSYFNLSSRVMREILLKYLRVKVNHTTLLEWIREFGNPSYQKMYAHVIEQIEEDEKFERLQINKKVFEMK